MTIRAEYIDPLDLAYVAGFIDGEGCMTVGTSVTLKVAHTHRDTLRWLQSLFGGSISNHYSDSHTKDAWVWRVCAQSAVEALILIRPYLREKAERADLLIEYQSTVGPRGRKVPNEVLVLRDQLRAKAATL